MRLILFLGECFLGQQDLQDSFRGVFPRGGTEEPYQEGLYRLPRFALPVPDQPCRASRDGKGCPNKAGGSEFGEILPGEDRERREFVVIM